MLRLPYLRKPAGASSQAVSVELQIHPSDIRKRVRYLFLTRAQILSASVLAFLYLLLLALGAWVAPGVIGGFLNRTEYHTLAAERSRQGERLLGLVGRLDQLQDQADGLHLRMRKIFLAYGLPARRTAGPSPTAAAAAADPASDSIYATTIEQGNRMASRIAWRLGSLDGSLQQAQSWEREHPDQVRTTPSICPLRGADFVMTGSFSWRRSPFTRELDFHPGLDLAAPRGVPIHATADGVVAFAGQYPMSASAAWWRYGNLVIVRNGDGFVTLFGHCDEVSVKAGQRVRQGDVLATVGKSGWSTSPHVHYEVRRRGDDGVFRPVDPLIYVLDHRWQNEESLLLRARNVPDPRSYEPLPANVANVGK
jgi:murein DD-endopeptidase MepM/ murein hydrolase activator NlpD